MKVYHAGPSPFARKVRVTAAEKGLGDKLELIPVNPYDRPAELIQHSPLGKIPCLILDDGTELYDSTVICEYLDSLGDSPKLIPEAGMERFVALRRLALCDDILNQAFNISCEVNRRPEGERSAHWVEHWRSAVEAGINQLGRELPEFGDDLTMVHISTGIVLGYADFRLSEMIDWRAANPALAAWYADFSTRPAMANTRPDA